MFEFAYWVLLCVSIESVRWITRAIGGKNRCQRYKWYIQCTSISRQYESNMQKSWALCKPKISLSIRKIRRQYMRCFYYELVFTFCCSTREFLWSPYALLHTLDMCAKFKFMLIGWVVKRRNVTNKQTHCCIYNFSKEIKIRII